MNYFMKQINQVQNNPKKALKNDGKSRSNKKIIIKITEEIERTEEI